MNEQLAQQLMEYAKTGASLASSQVTEITREMLNYFIFEASLGILKGLIYVLIPFIVFKVLGTIKSAYEVDKDKHINQLAILGGIRALCIVGALFLVVFTTMDDGRRLAKIVLAPKVFLIEESAKIIKK